MTVIEFFDKNPLENMASALLFAPDKVIFIGDSRKQMQAAIEQYNTVLEKRGQNTLLSYKSVTKNNLQEIVSKLTELIEEHGELVFDLTGGKDLYLVAVGIIMERFRGRVQCHRINIPYNRILDCDGDGKALTTDNYAITVQENIALCGGEIIRSKREGGYTYDWDFSEEFCRDVEKLWSICKKNERSWNHQISTLAAITRYFRQPENTLTLTFERAKVTSTLAAQGFRFYLSDSLLQELEAKGLILDLKTEDTVSFTFKNLQIKKCLTTAGQVLELLIATRMRSLMKEDGTPVYQDVRTGVVSDWDRIDAPEEVRTQNEVDVIAMCGLIPVFISCKNGTVDTGELYKLNTVAQIFGQHYGKKVLIASDLDLSGDNARYIEARADDMDIKIVTDLDSLSMDELDCVLRSLWTK